MKKKVDILLEIGLGILSFIIPFIFLIIIFSINNIGLVNDNKTIIMMDMQSQYIAYLRNYRDILLNGGSFVYTNVKEFGGDFISIFSYYLASPFNLFVVLVNESNLPSFFLWTNIIKMSLAGLNFYILGRYVLKKKSLGTLIFSLGYSLISYSFVYLSNFMWLDGVMILPLVVLGMYLLKDNKYHFVYPLALSYALFSSWYIGFMICIFAVLFYVYLVINIDKNNEHLRLKFTTRFFIYSLLGGLVVSFLWFSSYLHFAGTKAGSTQFSNFKIFDFSYVLEGLLEKNYFNSSLITQYTGYASMFIGVIPLILFIIYFTNSKIKAKERITAGGITLFFILVLIMSPLYTLMHGGKEPTWFPTRFSFLIGFFISFVSMLSFDKRKDIKSYYYLLPVILPLLVILYLKYKPVYNDEYYPISVISIVIYYAGLILLASENILNKYKPKIISNKYAKLVLPIFLLALQGISMFNDGNNVISQNIKDNRYQSYETYLKDNSYQASVNKLKEYDTSFYRSELTFNRPGNYNTINNNPFFYSYNGLSSYSSTNIQSLDNFMRKVGYHYNGFFTKFEAGSTYSISSLFGIKYLIEDTDSYNNIHPSYLDYNLFNKLDIEDNNVDYYYNPNYVELGFLSDKTSVTYIGEGKKQSDGHTRWFDHFEYQNNIFKTLNNAINKDIFSPLSIVSVQTSIEYSINEDEQFEFKNIKNGDEVTITYHIDEDKLDNPIYIAIKDYNDSAKVYINNISKDITTYWHKGIYSLEKSNRTEYKIRLRFKNNISSLTYKPELYYEDLEVSKEYLTSLKQCEFKINKISNKLTSKEYIGEFNTNNENKDLIITLPYDNNIKIKIDNKSVETYKRLNEFTAVDVSSLDSGNHTISISYIDKGLVVSIPISLISGSLLIGLFFFYKELEKRIFKEKKFEEVNDVRN